MVQIVKNVAQNPFKCHISWKSPFWMALNFSSSVCICCWILSMLAAIFDLGVIRWSIRWGLQAQRELEKTGTGWIIERLTEIVHLAKTEDADQKMFMWELNYSKFNFCLHFDHLFLNMSFLHEAFKSPLCSARIACFVSLMTLGL